MGLIGPSVAATGKETFGSVSKPGAAGRPPQAACSCRNATLKFLCAGAQKSFDKPSLRGSAPIARHKGCPQSSARHHPSRQRPPAGDPGSLVQTSSSLRPFRSRSASAPRMGRPLPLRLATPAFARRRSACTCRDPRGRANAKAEPGSQPP